MTEQRASVEDLLRLTLVPGLGPVLIGRLLEVFGSARDAARCTPESLQRIRGIGPEKARSISAGLVESEALLAKELQLIADHSVRVAALGTPDYPALLAEIPSPPPVVYIKGALEPSAYALAIVGSRDCTPYGLEQADRFAGALARSGLTIVSGGARGIDAAAHRGAMRSGGKTIAVLGCGLAEVYPPEHRDLFDQIVANGGAIVSELPMRAQPEARNFPARNRIISGLSLGVLVIEAGAGSGSLITAHLAADDHGRDVFVVPGRVDSPASAGGNALLRDGEAAIALEPGDVIAALEGRARHVHAGTHADRYAPPSAPASPMAEGLTDRQRTILEAIPAPLTLEQIAETTGLDMGALRAEITILEIAGRVQRRGAMIHRRG